jgi:hypothetical protein
MVRALRPWSSSFLFSSYAADATGSGVGLPGNIDSDVRRRNLRLIDDMRESGCIGVQSCSIAVLLYKMHAPQALIETSHVGFNCSNHVVASVQHKHGPHASCELPLVGHCMEQCRVKRGTPVQPFLSISSAAILSQAADQYNDGRMRFSAALTLD